MSEPLPRVLPPGHPLDRRAAWLMRRLDLARRTQETQGDLGIADTRILWLLSDGRGRTLAEIAADLGLEQSTVNRQVNAALAEGLLVRHAEPGRAARVVTSTDQGRAMFDAEIERVLTAYQAAMDAIEPDSREDFLRDLETFVAHFETSVEREAGPGRG